jgi:Flp pilus assembly pilin Flp
MAGLVVSHRHADEAIRTKFKFGPRFADTACMDRIAKIARRLRGSAGQTMAEYALLIAVVAVVVIVAATLLGGNASSTLHSTANHL